MLFCMFHHLFLCVLLTAACMSVPYSPNWGQTCILLLCNPRAHNNNNSQKHSLSIYHVPNTVLLSSIFLFNLKNNPKRFSLVQSLSHVRLLATPWTVHARSPCPSPTPRACSNSCPSSQWCHPIISSSVIPFSSHLQSFPASGSFPMS